jgi:hypothetical protein
VNKDTPYQQLRGHLAYLKLSAAAEALPTQLDAARDTTISHTEFLEALLAIEVEATEYERLVNVGTAEYARGRVLAVGAFTESIDGIIGYLGDSDEVGELVREQTMGVTGAAVLEIRETGAAADGLTEGIFRKIFRRDIQSVPPKPRFEQG